MTINQFKWYQRELRMTAPELAKALGVHRNTVHRWRMGVNRISNQVATSLKVLLHVQKMERLIAARRKGKE